MRWMETITLRSIETSANLGVAELVKQMLILSGPSAQRLVDIKIYRLAGIETDFSIHIHWDGNAGFQGKSSLGLRLANNLKYIGLIDHSIWIENGG
ncbi:MAG: hypothetical protein HY881_07850 [Deltaproteobacteria bacterium]|nr:hypothetical protein [Deltaproteobacteria bacterium]